MGFQENRDKTQVLCHGSKRREQALEAGFEERHLHSSIRILGLDFSRTPASPCGDARLKEGKVRAQRVQAAPVGFHSKANALATCVVPLATWGWWLKPLTDAKGRPVQRAIWKALGNTMVSRDLAKMLLGHGLDCTFKAGIAAWRAWTQAHNSLGGNLRWLQRQCRGIWQQTICNWMSGNGWTLQQPGQWTQPQLGATAAWNEQNWGRLQHQFREAWRRTTFQNFLDGDRREAVALQPHGVAHNEQVVKRTRLKYSRADAHQRAVLTGAAVSDACMAAAPGVEPPEECFWCQTCVTPSWHHVCWECTGFSADRPPVPVCRLQRRLGWLSSGDRSYDESVLCFMANVREAVLDRRRERA